jgi:hypothetical protein
MWWNGRRLWRSLTLLSAPFTPPQTRGLAASNFANLQGVVKRTVPPGANKDLFLASLVFYPECSSDL